MNRKRVLVGVAVAIVSTILAALGYQVSKPGECGPCPCSPDCLCKPATK